MNDYLVEVKDIHKQYPGVHALRGVSFNIKRGCVHCIIGENGAGKSTFIKILTGAEKSDGGEIIFDGKKYEPRSIKDAMQAGMSVLYQELNIIDELTVRQNLSLGKERVRFGIISENDATTARTVEVMRGIDPSISPDTQTAFYSMAKKQVIEISKAVAEDAKLIIMDEPTAAISDEEARRLFDIIDELKKQGVTIIYISHRLDDIFRIGDYITVFRDGNVVATKPLSEVEGRGELIRLMLGKTVFQKYEPGNVNRSKVVLTAKGLKNRVLKNISFDLYEGEILGFYGLIGAGKTEIARAIFGADVVEGELFMYGKRVRNRQPHEAIRNEIALVPEERRTQGIFSGLSIRENISAMNTRKITRGIIVDAKKERRLAEYFIEKLQIATDSMEKEVAYLSGGNQQKVVLSKCINADTKVLMLDEPTRGVDVGAKTEIHRIIRELAKSGIAIIVFSSELEEIVNLCDRILLLYDGRLKDELENGDTLNQEKIMKCVTGG